MSDADLSAGQLEPADKTKVEDYLDDEVQAREFRKITFYGAAGLSAAFLISLLVLLWLLWSRHGAVAAAGQPISNSLIVLFGVSIFALGAVGLSLMLAMIRLSSRPRSGKSDDLFPLTTPAVELFKAVASALRGK